MGLFGPSKAPEHSLTVLGYGGTIMSEPVDGVIMPNKESLTKLVAAIPAKRFKQFTNVRAELREPFIDSSDATVQTLMHVVDDVRRELREGDADRLVILYGSDTMSYLMAALGFGISKKELNGKSVVVTCAMNHLQHPKTDAMTNFNNAVLLSLTEEIKGRIGLLFARRFFPAIGLEKRQISTDFAFLSRFRRGAKLDRSNWTFDRQTKPFDFPMGVPDADFKLSPGVQPFTVTPMTDYSKIAGQISENEATVLVGLGSGNLRSDPESLGHIRDAVDQAKGPVIVVGAATYDAEQEIDMPRKSRGSAEVYQGHATLVDELISGGVMTQTEAVVFVSMKIAEAKSNGITKKSEIEEFVRFAIMNYAYIDLQSSRVRNLTKK